jgi:hypothetical protein
MLWWAPPVQLLEASVTLSGRRSSSTRRWTPGEVPEEYEEREALGWASFPQLQELRNSNRFFICSADRVDTRVRIRRSCSPIEYRC